MLPALAILALILGTIGYAQADASFWNALYQSLQLFSLNATPGSDVPAPLHVARFLAPAVAGFAAAAAILALFRDQVQQLRVRLFARNHTVIAGLGVSGSMLASELPGQLVAVERELMPAVNQHRSRGVTVIVGDATDHGVLERARVSRAQRLIVTCGDDATNLDVLIAANRVAQHAVDLEALVHLDDIDLWRLMEAEILTKPDRFGPQVQFFNVFEIAARLLLEEHPPFAGAEGDGSRPHLLFVGLDGVGESLLLHVAGQWRRTAGNAGQLRITLADPAGRERLDALASRHPELDSILDTDVRSIDVGSASFRRGDLLPADRGDAALTAVYVLLDPARKGLAAALALRAGGEVDGTPIVVAVDDEDGGVGSAIREGGSLMPDVHAFGVMSRTMTPDLLRHGTSEIIARAMHENFVRTNLARGVRRDEKVTMQPWSSLPEPYKQENRWFAKGIAPKLSAAGCAIVPNPLAQTGNDGGFSVDEIERLARIEHDRWCKGKRRLGWRYAPIRDDERKLHPSLVPWDELSEPDRDKDRDAVRALPSMLAQAGFEIYRVRDATGGVRPTNQLF